MSSNMATSLCPAQEPRLARDCRRCPKADESNCRSYRATRQLLRPGIADATKYRDSVLRLSDPEAPPTARQNRGPDRRHHSANRRCVESLFFPNGERGYKSHGEKT